MFQTLQSTKKLNDLNVGSGQHDVSLPTIIALFGPGNWFIIRGLLETEQPRRTQLNRPSLTLACRNFRFLKSKQHRIIQIAFKKPGEPPECHSVCGREKKLTVSCHFQRWRAGHRYFLHIRGLISSLQQQLLPATRMRSRPPKCDVNFPWVWQ